MYQMKLKDKFSKSYEKEQNDGKQLHNKSL